jgi:Domain of unknown function (DUF4276)
MATWVNGSTVVSSMSKLRIALIAEDDTDCDVIRTIVHHVLGKDVSTKKWSSKGCSTLRQKLAAQLSTLSKAGCNVFVVVHDLDRNPENGTLNDEAQLRKILEKLASDIEQSARHICIPIEELEAWFWADPKVIKCINKDKGKASANPQSLVRPKEALIKLSRDEKRRPRYSTNMNAELAKELDLELCAQRCESFRGLKQFLESLKS